MSLSNILLIPGIGQMSFRDALSILSPYSPRLAFNFIDPTNSLFQGTTLTPATTVTNPIGVVIDQTQGGLNNLGAELKSTGVVGLVGTATAATYNTTTGEGTVTRVDVSNQSFVSFSGLAVGHYRIEITNTGATTIRVISGTQTGTVIASISSGQSATLIGPSASNQITIAHSTSAATGSFTLISFKAIPGNHATASSDAKRPLWNSFTVNNRTVRGAVFDGSDDCLQVSGFDMSNTDEVCVIAGVRKVASVGGMIVEHTANSSTTSGSFRFFDGTTGGTVGDFVAWHSRGTATSTLQAALAVSSTAHIVGVSDISGDVAKIVVNGTSASVSADQGTGNYANSTLNIGQRNNATLPYNGYVHYLFICGAIVPDEILTRIYRGLAPQIGVSV